MTQEIKHSPLPWRFEDKHPQQASYEILGVDDKYPLGCASISRYSEPERVELHLANAEFIVRACNSHYDMLEALISVVSVGDRKTVEFDKARAAIAKATGGEA